MKTIILFLTATLIGGVAQAKYQSSHHNRRYKLTLVNLTKGQPLTPALVAVHQKEYQLFSLGEEASEGLKIQAKDGAVDQLVKELSEVPAVKSTAISSGVLLPGQSTQVEFSARRGDRISLTSMLARTNDAFVGGKGLYLPSVKGSKAVYLLKVYDAGAEINTESCSHIPAPPCESHFADTESSEGFVHVHPGIQNIGDLDPLRDAFSVIAAKVIIERQ